MGEKRPQPSLCAGSGICQNRAKSKIESKNRVAEQFLRLSRHFSCQNILCSVVKQFDRIGADGNLRMSHRVHAGSPGPLRIRDRYDA